MSKSKQNLKKQFVEIEFDVVNGKTVLKGILADGSAFDALTAIYLAHNLTEDKLKKYADKHAYSTKTFKTLFTTTSTFDLGLFKIKNTKNKK